MIIILVLVHVHVYEIINLIGDSGRYRTFCYHIVGNFGEVKLPNLKLAMPIYTYTYMHHGTVYMHSAHQI